MSECKPCCEPYQSCCWPDDDEFCKGTVELRIPSSAALKAYFHADVLDSNGVPPDTIIKTGEGFKVRFRVELCGELWKCITGCWCFGIGFVAIGDGEHFDLSTKLSRDLFEVKDWTGCKNTCGPCDGRDCYKVELVVDVPPNTVPAPACGVVYECAARAAFFCCCCETEGHDDPAFDHWTSSPVLTGFHALEEREFYS